jgi:hypothetical protein
VRNDQHFVFFELILLQLLEVIGNLHPDQIRLILDQPYHHLVGGVIEMLLVYALSINLLRPPGTVLALLVHLVEELAVDASSLDNRDEEYASRPLPNGAHKDEVAVVAARAIDSPSWV